jgi:hypothetical protein
LKGKIKLILYGVRATIALTGPKLAAIVAKAQKILPPLREAMAGAKIRISELRMIKAWAKLKMRSKVAYYVLMSSFIAYSVGEVLQSFVGIEISEKLSRALRSGLPNFEWPDTPDELAMAIEMFMAGATPADMQKLAQILQDEGLDLTLEDGGDPTELIGEDVNNAISKILGANAERSDLKEVMIGLDREIGLAEASDSPQFSTRLRWLKRLKTTALRHGVSLQELKELKEVLAAADSNDFDEAELVH